MLLHALTDLRLRALIVENTGIQAISITNCFSKRSKSEISQIR